MGDTKYRNLRENFTPIVFLPLGQDADPDPTSDATPPIGSGNMGAHIVVRTDVPIDGLMEPVKQAVAALVPNTTMTFNQLPVMIHASTITERLMATLAGFFGLLAALLAAVGVYGVVAYDVAHRTREIGMRMALGAHRRMISMLVLNETGKLMAIELCLGLLLGLAATKASAAMLFGLAPHDPTTVALAITLMSAVALIASVVPAYRAATVDPIVALREE